MCHFEGDLRLVSQLARAPSIPLGCASIPLGSAESAGDFQGIPAL